MIHLRDALSQRPLGFGSMMHRICMCVALAIQSNQTCLIDDSVFSYDPGNMRYYFTSLQQCQAAYKAKRISYLDGKKSTPHSLRYGLRNVPLRVKQHLEYCVEDIQAWYIGVLMKHMFKGSLLD